MKPGKSQELNAFASKESATNKVTSLRQELRLELERRFQIITQGEGGNSDPHSIKWKKIRCDEMEGKKVVRHEMR